MNINEYANEVGIRVEEILKLCDKLNISYENEDSFIDDEAIILLDNNIDTIELTEEEKDFIQDEKDEETALELAQNTKIDLDNTTSFTKLKKQNKSNINKKEEFFKERKKIYKNKKKLKSNDEISEDVIVYNDNMNILSLSSLLDVDVTTLIKKLMSLGIMANQNQALDFDTVSILLADYNKTLKNANVVDITNFEEFETEDKEEDLIERAPVVTIMGHVDHGKTSLLDYIRNTDVVSAEAGGITQAIGAYTVKHNDKKITFIDTPGHAAFTKMRARGASITDIVIIIVAADDGVMPQTKEAIEHAKEANVPIIVAINKIDKEDANVEKVMTALTEVGLTPEEWGGDIMVNKISAKTGEGVDSLLENILLVAEMAELKANPNRYATGVVIESRKDPKVGSIVTLLIQNGTLRLGDPIVVGTISGKVRTLKDDKGKNIVKGSISEPVEVTGLSEVPSAGDKFMAFETEKQAKDVAVARSLRENDKSNNKKGLSLDDLFSKIKDGIKEIKVVLKADVNGSLEAVKTSLEKIDVEGVKVNVVRGGVGAITESDVVLASASNAIIIGFNVRCANNVLDIAKQYNISIKTYDIIYKVVEEVTSAMKGMLDPEFEEVILGNAEVRQIFKFSKVGLIAGCHVIDGVVKINSKARLIRDGVVIYNGSIKSLQHEKETVKEMKKGLDCGITLENNQDYKENDIIEAYELKEVKK